MTDKDTNSENIVLESGSTEDFFGFFPIEDSSNFDNMDNINGKESFSMKDACYESCLDIYLKARLDIEKDPNAISRELVSFGILAKCMEKSNDTTQFPIISMYMNLTINLFNKNDINKLTDYNTLKAAFDNTQILIPHMTEDDKKEYIDFFSSFVDKTPLKTENGDDYFANKLIDIGWRQSLCPSKYQEYQEAIFAAYSKIGNELGIGIKELENLKKEIGKDKNLGQNMKDSLNSSILSAYSSLFKGAGWDAGKSYQ